MFDDTDNTNDHISKKKKVDIPDDKRNELEIACSNKEREIPNSEQMPSVGG